MEKILVSGVFEILHPGYLHYFEGARKLSKEPKLVVLVTRDFNLDYEPVLNEEERKEVLEKLELVDKVIMGYKDRSFKRILKEEKPDFLALGYDQKYEKKLEELIKELGIETEIVRISAKNPEKYSSSKLVGRK